MPVQVLQRPQLFNRLSSLPNRVGAGVAIKGPARAYGLVWEWGSVRLKRPGPKTTYGTNPDSGQQRIFTLTAPSGYFRVHRAQFYEMAKTAVSTIDVANELQRGTFVNTLRDRLMKVATETAQIAAHDAPVDTGALRAGIVAIGEVEAEQLREAAYRPLLIGDFTDE